MNGLFIIVIVVQIGTIICLLRLNKLIEKLMALMKENDLTKEDWLVQDATEQVRNAKKRIPPQN